MRSFRPRPARKNWPRAIATTIDNRKWKHRRFELELAISGSHSLSKSFGYSFIELVVTENHEFVVGISTLCHSSRVEITSDFRGHIDTFGCRSLLLLPCQHYFLPLQGLRPQICRWNFNCTVFLRDISMCGFGRGETNSYVAIFIESFLFLSRN